MSLSFRADVLHLLLLSHVLQRVAAGGGMDYGSSSNSPNHPVIELIGTYHEVINPDPNYCQPPHKLRILEGDSSPSSALKSNERKSRLCPLPKSDVRAKRIFKHDKLSKYCLFEVNEDETFCENEVKPYLTEFNSDPVASCLTEESKKMYKLGSELCFPYVKDEDNKKTYKKGIQGFLHYVDQHVNNTTKEFHSYLLCYNNETNRTEWAQRSVKPVANLQRRYDTEPIKLSTDELDLQGNGFEKMRKAFEEQDKNSPDTMVPQLLIPKEENSYLLWEINTSHYINVAPLWISLVPLMNLINERIALLAHRIKKALLVRTYPFYTESIQNATKTYLDKDEEILIPNIWTITEYEEDSDSGISIVLYNAPNEPPISKELCDVVAFCDFKKWVSTSTTESIGKGVDGYLGYAYCCRMNTFKGLRVENVIDINFEGEIARN